MFNINDGVSPRLPTALAIVDDKASPELAVVLGILEGLHLSSSATNPYSEPFGGMTNGEAPKILTENGKALEEADVKSEVCPPDTLGGPLEKNDRGAIDSAMTRTASGIAQKFEELIGSRKRPHEQSEIAEPQQKRQRTGPLHSDIRRARKEIEPSGIRLQIHPRRRKTHS